MINLNTKVTFCEEQTEISFKIILKDFEQITMNSCHMVKMNMYIFKIFFYTKKPFSNNIRVNYKSIFMLIIHYIAKSIGSPPSNEQVWLF